MKGVFRIVFMLVGLATNWSLRPVLRARQPVAKFGQK
jgi:uncharacterized membrane protein YuzA (DUF378 family)